MWIWSKKYTNMKLYKKLIKKHIHKTAKSKPTSNKLKEEVFFYLENALFIRAKEGW